MRHPLPPDARFAGAWRDLLARVRRVETRTATLDPGLLVCVRSGVVATAGAGTTTVTLAGQPAASGPYPALATYTPTAGDTVLLIPLGQSYVIAGRYA